MSVQKNSVQHFFLVINCKLQTSKCYVSWVCIKVWMFIYSETRNENIAFQATIQDQDRILSMVKCIYIFICFLWKSSIYLIVLSAMPVCKLHVFHPVILLYISCVVDEMFNAPILGNLPCPEKNPGCVPGQLVFLSHNNFQTTHQHHRNMS